MFRGPRRHLAADSTRRAGRRPPIVPVLEPLESRRLLTSYYVRTTQDNGDDLNPTTDSLRAAIVASNQATPGPNAIIFQIPASNDPSLTIPVPGFDPVTQTWTITPPSAMPPITTPVVIDGFTQAHSGTPFWYPNQTESTQITSAPNSTAATSGNNARVRVIIDGSATSGATAFVLDTSHAILRGLVIDGFDVGISVPNAGNVGNLIQGTFIGKYLVYPVDPTTGDALEDPYSEAVTGRGNGLGVVISGTNTTLGGPAPQEDNVIAGNRAQGVWLKPGSEGSQVQGNQIGVIGPSDLGVYWDIPNGAEGIRVESSSNRIGASGVGNLISANLGDGVAIVGSAATLNIVAGNYIGVGPGGGYILGNGNPGNQGNGVTIQDAPNNVIGGTSTGAGNTISSNLGAGVSITGSLAVGTFVIGNIIGLTADGKEPHGNSGPGVAVSSPSTQVGPGNVISANRVGVLISGSTVSGVTVTGNLIGTDGTGTNDIGNAFQGVLIDGAHHNVVTGDSQGSQVISGNNVGVAIEGSTATGNLVAGNLIGTDKSGALALPNAQQGVLLRDAPGNTIGGTGGTDKNLISANHWGIQIDGAAATAIAVLGNLVGTDLTGLAPVGNEVDGVLITGSSGNSIGGAGSSQGNTIAFNGSAGVNLLAGTGGTVPSLGNAILSNAIFSNSRIGISLNGGSNDAIAAPAIAAAAPDVSNNTTYIKVSYAPQASSTFLIQFFTNAAADPAGNYEGQTLIGVTILKTDAGGNLIGGSGTTFEVDVPVVVASGSWITATATYLTTSSAASSLNHGDSSEFSPGTQAINPFVVTTTVDDVNQPGTLAHAIAFSNNHPSISLAAPNLITFQIPGNGLHTITLLSSLSVITQPLIIDGYSQPGSRVNDSSQEAGIFVLDDQETDIATLTIQLDGSQLDGESVSGLTIAAPNCTVSGLIITGFSGAGIALEPASNAVAGTIGDTLWGNFIGVTQFNIHSFNPVNPARNIWANGVGIRISSGNNLIGGTTPTTRNIIQGNAGAGVIVAGGDATRNTLASNFILDNGGDGVLILSANNQVGQATAVGPAGAGNVISGNRGNGVHVLGPAARGNVVVGNEIGTQVGVSGQVVPIRGTRPRPNSGNGVLIENAPVNVVGGQVPFAGNVIAGNTRDGVSIQNYVDGTVPSSVPATIVDSPPTAATGNQVQGNLIGFNQRSTRVYLIPNRDGIFLASSASLVGGDSAAARNVIIANNRNGITISASQLDDRDNPLAAIPNAQASSNVVRGNFIGTQAGTNAAGNGLDGILISGGRDNTIGGTTTGSANVIAANNIGVVIQAATATNNVVVGNTIGLTADGLAPLGNAAEGVAILDSPGNLVGGTLAGAGNVISGNGNGVHLSGSTAIGNLVWSNLIGTNAQGGDLVGNSRDGVLVDNAASNNLIGQTAGGAGGGNTIAFNAGSGVAVLSGTGNSILSNAVFSNGVSLPQEDPQKGIALVGTANQAQAAPLVTAAIPTGSTTNIQGSLASTPSASFRVQFFGSATGDPSGFGQGQVLIGATIVSTDAHGNGDFNVTLATTLPSGWVVTATATNLATGDTSGFSNDASSQPILVGFSAAIFSAGVSAGSATISVLRTGNTNARFAVAYATSDGTAHAGVHYTATSGQLSFGLGQTVGIFTIPVTAGTPPSGSLTIHLALSDPTAGATLISPSSAVLTIVDSRPMAVQFSAASYSITEPDGSAVIAVTRNTTAGTATVVYTATAGTAIPGSDFTPVSGTLTFSPGQSSQSFTVPIRSGLDQAGQRTVVLALSAPSGVVLGTPSTATLTIHAPGGTFRFAAEAISVAATAESAVVTVIRAGGSSGFVAVHYAATAGRAIPGVDFTPVSGTLTFAPGVTEQSFVVPVPAAVQDPYDATVVLSLTDPTGGAGLGSPTSAIVTIVKLLIVTSEQVLTDGRTISGITLTFNKPLDPARAEDLGHFGYFIFSAGSDGVFGTHDDGSTPIRSAIYNPSSLGVTLTPAARLPLNRFHRITLEGLATPLLNNGLMDLLSIPLGEPGGIPGAPFVATFAAGTRLIYRDGSGNLVKLQLKRGGLIELFRSPDGNAHRLSLIGAIPGRSLLTGSVHRRHGGAGRTALPPIGGATGVRIRLQARAFASPRARVAAGPASAEPEPAVRPVRSANGPPDRH